MRFDGYDLEGFGREDHDFVIRMFRGDSKSFLRQILWNPQTLEYITIGPTESAPNGFVGLNVTGWRVWFTAKYHTNDPDPSAVMQLDNLTLGGLTFVLANAGQIMVTTPPLKTFAFPDGLVPLHADFQGKDTSGNIRTFHRGLLIVRPDITAATS